MGSVGTVLSLDFRPNFEIKTITDFLSAISAIGNVSEKASKLDGFIKLLEEELKKIEAFKRELPFCMLLLNDAILVLKEELAQCVVSRKCQPVLEEFIPLKKDDNGDEKDKKNWMSSVRLCNNDEEFHLNDQESRPELKNSEDLVQGCKERRGIEAFTPFKPYECFPLMEGEKQELAVPDLRLLAPEIRVLRKDLDSLTSRATSKKADSSLALIAQPNFQYEPQPLQLQTARKQRRCWSQELHRRFVDALEKLGGPQVATPKQIKELMQVDGLTNDEVKSHLQKYRLHARKRSPTTTTSTSVIGGGLLMSQDQYDTDNSSKGNASHSSSPESPLQLASDTKDDIMEDEEDAKSESYGWRSDVHQPGKIAV